MTYLIHIPVDMNKLSSWSMHRGMRTEAGPDIRRALHHLLDESFGQSALKPFRMYAPPGMVGTGAIYGYTDTPVSDLVETSRMIACPDALDVISIEGAKDKEMPSSWKAERRVGFDLCTIPVRRVSGSNKEIDTYVRDVNKAKDSKDSVAPSRRESYLKWLDERLGGAADVVWEATNVSSQSTITNRKGEVIRRTEAKFTGDVVIKDPELFAEKLRNGIGRHKSYGYGMMILRGPNNRRSAQART